MTVFVCKAFKASEEKWCHGSLEDSTEEVHDLLVTLDEEALREFLFTCKLTERKINYEFGYGHRYEPIKRWRTEFIFMFWVDGHEVPLGHYEDSATTRAQRAFEAYIAEKIATRKAKDAQEETDRAARLEASERAQLIRLQEKYIL